MIANFNIGLLGHVDSGKTTLARALSAISSTAAFDKNPQSQQRGITLDLGFSGLLVEAPQELKEKAPLLKQLQYTFVDCPGHASLIRTIIGGAQIIDLMLLVIDAQKGIQTQTAECLIIGELLQKKLIIVVNKIDMLEEDSRVQQLNKLTMKLRKTLAGTRFGADVPIFNVAAQHGTNIKELLAGICAAYFVPERDASAPFLMYVDHCFSIKGQGTICTGTVIQGCVRINETIEIPALGEQRKVKSMQIFRRAVNVAMMGDRVGLCMTQFNSKLLERGVIAQPGYLKPIYAACVRVQCIRYFKSAIKSKSKFHISVGHDTVMANVTLFSDINNLLKNDNNNEEAFDCAEEYEYVDELDTRADKIVYALLEFETSILTTKNAPLIASKLDMDVHGSGCRLAFWGRIQWFTHASQYAVLELPKWKIFKRKCKQGNIQRVVNEQEVIVQNLFKKEANRDMYVGKTVELSTGEIGQIESTFGSTSKVRICFRNAIKTETLDLLKNGRSNEVIVMLKFKKYIFNKGLVHSLNHNQ